MPTEYLTGTEAQHKAAPMIQKHHSHLNGVDIIFVFVRKTNKDGIPEMWESSGEPVIGKVTKKSGLDAYLFQSLTDSGELMDFFVIQIDQYVWRSTAGLDEKKADEQRAAILDHLLCFCEIETTDTGDTQLKVRKEGVRGFVENIQRHGLWQNAFEKFAKASQPFVKQLMLPTGDEPADKAAAKGNGRAKSKPAARASAAPRN